MLTVLMSWDGEGWPHWPHWPHLALQSRLSIAAALCIPVDVTECRSVDGLHRVPALQHPALQLLDPGFCLMDVTNLEESYVREEQPTCRGLHNRSATALALGHSRGVRLTEFTNSLHIHVSPPGTSVRSHEGTN